jgi:hypothetical protein
MWDYETFLTKYTAFFAFRIVTFIAKSYKWYYAILRVFCHASGILLLIKYTPQETSGNVITLLFTILQCVFCVCVCMYVCLFERKNEEHMKG